MNESIKYNFRIYRNLHKQCWSVQHYVPKVGWRLLEHLDSLEAVNCTTKVYEAGRQRVLSTKKKNVHSFILAEKVDAIYGPLILPSGTKIRYNPYELPYFYTRNDSGSIVRAAEKFGKATLTPDGVIINDLQS